MPVRIGLLAMSLWPWFFGHPANSRKWEYDSQRSLENIRRKTPWRVRGEGEIFGVCLSSERTVREEVTRGPDDRSAARDFPW